MKKLLLTLLLSAFAFSFSPVAMASAETAFVKEELPFFKKKKKSSSKARYKKIKRNNKSYSRKHSSSKKTGFLASLFN